MMIAKHVKTSYLCLYANGAPIFPTYHCLFAIWTPPLRVPSKNKLNKAKSAFHLAETTLASYTVSFTACNKFPRICLVFSSPNSRQYWQEVA